MISKYIIELGYRSITKRNITYELVKYNFSFPVNITHNVTNLTPYTTYMWRVAAATVNGTGPLSRSPKSFTTLQDGEADSCGHVKMIISNSKFSYYLLRCII